MGESHYWEPPGSVLACLGASWLGLRGHWATLGKLSGLSWVALGWSWPVLGWSFGALRSTWVGIGVLLRSVVSLSARLFAGLVGNLKQQGCCKATTANPHGAIWVLAFGACGDLFSSLGSLWVTLGWSRAALGDFWGGLGSSWNLLVGLAGSEAVHLY